MMFSEQQSISIERAESVIHEYFILPQMRQYNLQETQKQTKNKQSTSGAKSHVPLQTSNVSARFCTLVHRKQF
jgi:hypothetical protein